MKATVRRRGALIFCALTLGAALIPVSALGVMNLAQVSFDQPVGDVPSDQDVVASQESQNPSSNSSSNGIPELVTINQSSSGNALSLTATAAPTAATKLTSSGEVTYADGKYFYWQLPEDAKTIYHAFEAMDSQGLFKTGDANYNLADAGLSQDKIDGTVAGTYDLLATYGAARDAFYADHPEIFYVDFSNLTVRIINQNGKRVAYLGAGRTKDYFTAGITKENIGSALAEYESAVNAMLAAADSAGSNFEKVAAIHNYIIGHTSYCDETQAKEDAGFIRTAYGSLVKHKGVCEAYTRAFKAAMDRLGIPCVMVTGVYRHSGNQVELHIWNAVQPDDNWYAVDATMDDPVNKTRDPYMNVEPGDDGYENSDYLLASSEIMNRQHVESPIMSESNFEFIYPTLASANSGFSTIYEGQTLGEDGTLQSGGLKVQYNDNVMLDGPTYGEEAIGGGFLVSYDGMNSIEMAENGKYLLVRFYSEDEKEQKLVPTDWGYINSELYEAVEETEEGTKFPMAHVRYVEFGVTDIPPAKSDKPAEDKRLEDVLAENYYTGDPYLLLASTGMIENPNAPAADQAPPYIKAMSPASNGRMTINGSTYHVVVTYDQKLKLAGTELPEMGDLTKYNYYESSEYPVTDPVLVAQIAQAQSQDSQPIATVDEATGQTPTTAENGEAPESETDVADAAAYSEDYDEDGTEAIDEEDSAQDAEWSDESDELELTEKDFDNGGTLGEAPVQEAGEPQEADTPSVTAIANENPVATTATGMGKFRLKVDVTDPWRHQVDLSEDEMTLTNLQWDGESTISFDFRPSSNFNKDTVFYTFEIENLVSAINGKKPNDISYCVSYPCQAFAYRNEGFDWNVFGKPQLMDTDPSQNLEDVGTGLSDRLMLVVTDASNEQTSQMKDLMEDEFSGAVLEGCDTYNINLTLCKMQKVETGQAVRVSVGFPNGYGPEDEGVVFKAYHFTRDAQGNVTGVEEIPCIVTKYGLIILCDSFSPFAIAAVSGDESSVDPSVVLFAGDGGTITRAQDPGSNEAAKANGVVNTKNVFTPTEPETVSIQAKGGYVIDQLTVGGQVVADASGKSSHEITVDASTVAQGTAIVDASFISQEAFERFAALESGEEPPTSSAPSVPETQGPDNQAGSPGNQAPASPSSPNPGTGSGVQGNQPNQQAPNGGGHSGGSDGIFDQPVNDKGVGSGAQGSTPGASTPTPQNPGLSGGSLAGGLYAPENPWRYPNSSGDEVPADKSPVIEQSVHTPGAETPTNEGNVIELTAVMPNGEQGGNASSGGQNAANSGLGMAGGMPDAGQSASISYGTEMLETNSPNGQSVPAIQIPTSASVAATPTLASFMAQTGDHDPRIIAVLVSVAAVSLGWAVLSIVKTVRKRRRKEMEAYFSMLRQGY